MPVPPKTLFHYYGENWFSWVDCVEAMRSPIAQDQYNRVYYTDGIYPKVTDDAIATGGATKPAAWYRLGVPAPVTAPNLQSITPPAGEVDDAATDDDPRFYMLIFDNYKFNGALQSMGTACGMRCSVTWNGSELEYYGNNYL